MRLLPALSRPLPQALQTMAGRIIFLKVPGLPGFISSPLCANEHVQEDMLLGPDDSVSLAA